LNIPLIATLDTESNRIIRMDKFRADLEASGVLKDLNGSFLNDIACKDGEQDEARYKINEFGGMSAVVARDSHSVNQLGSIPSPATYKEHIVEPFHPSLIPERQDTQLSNTLHTGTDCTKSTQGNVEG
jgi:hypothetical protein